MYLLAIQKDHLSSVALFKDNKLFYYNQNERLSKRRKHSGFPFQAIEQVKDITKKVDMALITGYDIDGYNNGHWFDLLRYHKLIEERDTEATKSFSYHKSHHLSHAAKAYYSSGFDKAIIFVIDGRGSEYNLTNGEYGYETSSVFQVENQGKDFKCIYKKVSCMSDDISNVKILPNVQTKNLFQEISIVSVDKNYTNFELSNDIDLGMFYSNVSEYLGFFEEEGKLMGLASYGKPNKFIRENIDTNILIPNRFPNIHTHKSEFLEKIKYNDKEDIHLDLAFETQRLFEEKYYDFVKKHMKKGYDLILTGGTALNVQNNFKLRKKIDSTYKIYADPLCGDEGTSIGIGAYYLNNVLDKKTNHKDIGKIYLNPRYEYDYILNENEIETNASLDDIVNLLIDGKIVALFQGGGEGGPRALGNRSLLLDPRIENGKDIMNTVKNRESFRPFACSVLEEKVKDWFDINCLDNSPAMMYSVDTLQNKKHLIKSVVHIDDTCRIQTISKDLNLNFYNLLKKFDEKTGVPLLMNTSFNVAGDPIVEFPQDALNTLRKSNIEYLYFPDIEKLVYIKNNEV